MDWEQVAAKGEFIAERFAFSDGGRMDVRLAYRTLGAQAPGHCNAVLLLHGTTGSGRQFLLVFAASAYDKFLAPPRELAMLAACTCRSHAWLSAALA